ncbi:energy transducer TonB [Spirosoma sordidisoli]|uniref:TonB C-terminal domain-containing protein n=1 Tax=Spirosoma sordidisoli TaxID=2502893 RepID=A0A4Q2UFA5_9BACT|nr:energy transducer TonB [Spirosoma sordidisoli]RYC67032.1 hypothetical protein EQG79_27050 [Spirosoma sordidisoli]
MRAILKATLCLLGTVVLSQSPMSIVRAQQSTGKVYTVAERQPEFPGGKAALSRYLATNIKFPGSLMRQNANTGPVAAKFIVDVDGSVHDVRITTKPLTRENKKGMQEFMAAIVTAVEKMPRWRPGEVGGRPVAVFYTLPIEVNMQ